MRWMWIVRENKYVVIHREKKKNLNKGCHLISCLYAPCSVYSIKTSLVQTTRIFFKYNISYFFWRYYSTIIVSDGQSNLTFVDISIIFTTNILLPRCGYRWRHTLTSAHHASALFMKRIYHRLFFVTCFTLPTRSHLNISAYSILSNKEGDIVTPLMRFSNSTVIIQWEVSMNSDGFWYIYQNLSLLTLK